MQVIFNISNLSYQNLSAVRELQQDRKTIRPSEVMSVTEECCLSGLHESSVWKSTKWSHILEKDSHCFTCMWTALPSAGRVAVCQSVGKLRTSCYPEPSSEEAHWGLTLHSLPSIPAQSSDPLGTETTCQKDKWLC